MKKGNKGGLIAVAAVLIVALLGWNIYLSYRLNLIGNSNTTTTNTVVNKTVSEIKNTFTDVVDKTQDKVVVVYNYRGETLQGSGSGVVYKADGRNLTIVTNHHVVDGSRTLKVKFANGEIFEAKLVGSDEYSDLAVLTVTVDFDLAAFTLGDSSLTSVGEQVLALGSPLGEEYQGSVTAGIISGKDRLIPVDLNNDGTADWEMVVLQTDAAINPGNSGGALVNLAGELIGIPSSKIQSSNGTSVEGMGFAIPVNEVIPIVTQLIETGEVTRPTIGINAVSLDDLTTFQKQSNGISSDQTGLYISSVVTGGPAQKAGIQAKDIIVKFDGNAVVSFKDFRRQLYQKQVGDKVNVVILRDGKEVSVEVTLA